MHLLSFVLHTDFSLNAPFIMGSDTLPINFLAEWRSSYLARFITLKSLVQFQSLQPYKHWRCLNRAYIRIAISVLAIHTYNFLPPCSIPSQLAICGGFCIITL